MSRKATLLLVITALAAAAYALPRGKQPAAVAAPIATPLPVPTAVAAQPAATAPSARDAAAPTADRSRQLELPDGTFVPALNGATDPAPLQQFWGSQLPWSPIVGVERNDQGVDWYRHADGSYSTTEMVWRSDLSRHAAMTRVAHPGPAVTPPVAR